MPKVTSILITRPKLDAIPLAEKLSNLGYAPLVWPLIEIQNRPAPQGLSVQEEDVYAFTSANGVRAASAAKLPVRCAFAVGPATLEACHQAGYPAQAATGDVASLVALISAAKPTGRILHISGRDLAGDLCASLTSRDLRAENIPLYAAEAQSQMPQEIHMALTQSNIDAVMLYSKRTASIFCQHMQDSLMIDRLNKTHFLCLSAAVAETLISAGYQNCQVAKTPTETALLELLL